MLSKLLVFLLGAASSRSACAAVLRPATFCLLVCFAVLLFEQPYCGLLAISSPDSSHAVAWIMFVLVRLLAFSPGAASSRFARAAVLRPAPFCLLVSFALISSRRLFLCDGCGRPFWGYSPFCVTFHILWLGSCFCLVCLVFPLGAALRALPARRFFALPPTPCCLLPMALRPLLPTSHQLCLGSWLGLCSCWRFCWAPLLHGLLPRLFFALPLFLAYLG